MTSNYAKAFELRKAIKQLDETNALVQATLGAGSDTYAVHCKIEALQTTLAEYCDMLIEMQITD